MQSKKYIHPLPTQERAFLIIGGALGVNGDQLLKINNSFTTLEAENSHMLTTSLNLRETAKLLGISNNKVHKRIYNGTLYGIDDSACLVCPLFQFFGNATLPNLEKILAIIDHQAHPAIVQRFFLTPNFDLELEDSELIFTPREWLIARHTYP